MLFRFMEFRKKSLRNYPNLKRECNNSKSILDKKSYKKYFVKNFQIFKIILNIYQYFFFLISGYLN